MRELRFAVEPPFNQALETVSRSKQAESDRVKDWEIIADNLSKAGWSWGCVLTINSNGRTIWIADADRNDGSVSCARG